MEPLTRAVLVLESAFSDVLCIVVTIALLEAQRTQQLRVLDVAKVIVIDFIVAVMIGASIALI